MWMLKYDVTEGVGANCMNCRSAEVLRVRAVGSCTTSAPLALPLSLTHVYIGIYIVIYTEQGSYSKNFTHWVQFKKNNKKKKTREQTQNAACSSLNMLSIHPEQCDCDQGHTELPIAGASARMHTFVQTTHYAGAPSVPLSCMHIVSC